MVPALAGNDQSGHFLPGEVGDDAQGLGEQCPAGDEGPLMHNKLDKSLFGPTLLLVPFGCQAQNARKRAGSAAKTGQKGFFCLIGWPVTKRECALSSIWKMW